ncbi:DNA helicase [Gracilaria domingensis]|nr:DNA helicase [Gracilaria domingensis]
MKILVASREKELGVPNDLVTVGLASRRHLCIHESVSRMEGSAVDSGCRALTSSWVRERMEDDEARTAPFCKYFETYDREGLDHILAPGVYNLVDLRVYGSRRRWCPYFLARHSIMIANILVYSYHYLLDPKVAGVVSSELPPESIIVFDEAHNIDNVCIEALSVDLEEPTIRRALRNITQLNSAIYRAKESAVERLKGEYHRLASGLPLAELNAEAIRPEEGHVFAGGEEIPAAPVLPGDVLREAVPDSIRKAEEFVEFLDRLTSFLEKRADREIVTQEQPIPFLRQVAIACGVEDKKVFKATYDRLISLLMTVHVASWSDFRPLLTVGDFITLLATYEKEGMAVITEPYNDFTGDYEPVLRLACLDASLAVRWVMNRFRTVVITSGTLSPLDTYPRMLNFSVAVSASFNMSLERRCVCPLIMTRGSDQLALSSKYSARQTSDTSRNYGHALIALAGSVPDGIVVFFVSYVFMQQVVKVWTEEGNLLDEIRRLKLLFVETQDPVEASLAIKNYKDACDSGRGAILLSVARGRAAEGIDFDGQYGRAVILFGVPFQYTESRVLKARLRFLAEKYQIQEDDFLVFDAMRQAAQCAGRVIRNKNDYGIVIFADKRFTRAKLRGKLPKWISQFLSVESLDLDLGTAIAEARNFLLEMAQPTAAKSRAEGRPPENYEFIGSRAAEDHA